jgi:vancomycin permeability regulator SanA
MDYSRKLSLTVDVVARGAAAFLGGFTLLNLAGEFVSQHFDSTIWWIDVRRLPFEVRGLWLGLLSVILLRFAIGRCRSRVESALALSLLTPALLLVSGNAVTYERLLAERIVLSGSSVSFSAVTAVVLVVICWSLSRQCFCSSRSTATGRRRKLAIAFVAVACCIGFPLLQIHCFGRTDYRRKADAAVVFGCRVYADGRLSAALEDRVRTGVELYRQGLVRHLVMTGGPGNGDIHETQAMRQFAIDAGVPARCILVDEGGWDTDHSVASTVPLCEKLGLRRVLAVSHDFHLPRIKLTYARAGWDVFTVPARQKYRLAARPFLLARETVALWAYYLRPLTHL